MDFLDFEKPIVELERRIEELRLTNTDADTAIELDDEIERLHKKCESLTKKIFGDLTEWQIAQLARHPLRPKSIQVIDAISEDFQELHGDRMYADDSSIVSGLAKMDGQSVMIIAQEKGGNTNEKMKRNFGMPRPEGYRKAQRMMKLAEKFSIPIVTIIDTPGAFPGIGAEERGQSEAIARNLFTLASLKTPIINLVLGEGGAWQGWSLAGWSLAGVDQAAHWQLAWGTSSLCLNTPFTLSSHRKHVHPFYGEHRMNQKLLLRQWAFLLAD